LSTVMGGTVRPVTFAKPTSVRLETHGVRRELTRAEM